jgi:hypothetical protein
MEGLSEIYGWTPRQIRRDLTGEDLFAYLAILDGKAKQAKQAKQQTPTVPTRSFRRLR